MGSACRLDDRPGLAASLVKPVEAGIGVGLHQPPVGRQMFLGMGAAAVW
jgi:hypothetical protein